MKTIATIFLAAALASCASMPPVALTIQGQRGTYAYSAKRGVEITIHATK